MGSQEYSSIDGALLDEVHRTFRAYFFEALGQSPRWSKMIVDEVRTKGNEFKPKMTSRPFGVEEWLDERQKSRIETFDHSVLVKRWANGIIVHEDDLMDDDDNLVMYRSQIAELADDFDEHQHQLVIDLINAGFGTTLGTGYDGVSFFNTAHPQPASAPGPATQSNSGTGVFSSSTLYQGIEDMELLRKPSGKNANVRPTHGIFPVALREAVEAILQNDRLANGATNILKGRIQPIFDPRLDANSQTAWYLVDMDKALKGFWFPTRRPVNMRMKGTDSDANFDRGDLEWGGDGRYNAGYGFWQVVYGNTGV